LEDPSFGAFSLTTKALLAIGIDVVFCLALFNYRKGVVFALHLTPTGQIWPFSMLPSHEKCTVAHCFNNIN
jgi:hypothetical protein